MTNITTSLSTRRDTVRQILNVVGAVGQVASTGVVYLVGSDNITSSDPSRTTPLVPADYTFIIWAAIYSSAIAYVVYQALPQHKTDELLRRIGFYTAIAFFGTSAWLFSAQNELQWLTVFIFFLILAMLIFALIEFIRYTTPLSRAENYFVVLPVSIYAGWATLATIVNTSTAFKASGVTNLGLSPAAWSVIMLVVGGLVGSFVVVRSRGNLWYSLTLIWALVGIVVANDGGSVNSIVAITAGAVAGLIAFVLVFTKIQGQNSLTGNNL